MESKRRVNQCSYIILSVSNKIYLLISVYRLISPVQFHFNVLYCWVVSILKYVPVPYLSSCFVSNKSEVQYRALIVNKFSKQIVVIIFKVLLLFLFVF